MAPLLEAAELPLPPVATWEDTCVLLPDEFASRPMLNVLTRREHAHHGNQIAVADLLAEIPVALLLRHPE